MSLSFGLNFNAQVATKLTLNSCGAIQPYTPPSTNLHYQYPESIYGTLTGRFREAKALDIRRRSDSHGHETRG